MSLPRNALYPIVGALALAVVACQPSDPVVEAGARLSHPVIEVPEGKTLLPVARPLAAPAAPLT